MIFDCNTWAVYDAWWCEIKQKILHAGWGRAESKDSYSLLSGGYCGEDEFISEETVNVIT